MIGCFHVDGVSGHLILEKSSSILFAADAGDDKQVSVTAVNRSLLVESDSLVVNKTDLLQAISTLQKQVATLQSLIDAAQSIISVPNSILFAAANVSLTPSTNAARTLVLNGTLQGMRHAVL